MKAIELYPGLDVHQVSITIAITPLGLAIRLAPRRSNFQHRTPDAKFTRETFAGVQKATSGPPELPGQKKQRIHPSL
jgi:hypothetical protein